MKIKEIKRRVSSTLLIAGFIFLPSCAGFLPVPGGDETINKTFYETDHDFLAAVQNLEPGMSEEQVSSILGREEDDFVKLNRSEIFDALYGGSDVELLNKFDGWDSANHFLQSFYGYRFSFKVVEQEHGFSSPIRIRTNESGYSYTASFIFQNGALYEKPILSGGVVNNTRSSTIFDYLSPRILLGGAGD